MASARLELVVQYACPRRGLPHRRSIVRWLETALATGPQRIRARITVRFVGQTEGRALNRDFRSKDYATNVLTFDYASNGESPSRAQSAAPMLIGDLVLCAPVVQREARAQNKELSAHYAHLLVHGVLHLRGHAHERDDEAQRMERLETHLMRQLGYRDPYV